MQPNVRWPIRYLLMKSRLIPASICSRFIAHLAMATSGTGDGLVGERLVMKPWNLTSSNEMHSWDPKDYPDGYIFGYMTLGGAVMPSYANDLSPTERWHVVNYVRRVLQKGQAGLAAAQSK